mgnify:CR=1 FL=1
MTATKTQPTWNDPKACYHCHGPLVGTPTRYATGTIDEGGTIGPLFVCSKECRDAKNRESTSTRPCVECGRGIPAERDKPRTQRRQYCDRACQKAAEGRRARVWKAASRSTLPRTVEENATMRTEVDRVMGEIEADVLLDKPPVAARGLLTRYRHELQKDANEMAATERRESEYGRYVEGRRQTAEAAQTERRALDDWLKQASRASGTPDEVSA